MKKSIQQKREIRMAWCFLLPGLVLISTFVFWPIIYSLPLAFTNYSGIGDTEFVGLENFQRLVTDTKFLTALTNSLLYILIVPIIQFLSILVAILLNSKLRGVKIFRTIYYIPVVTSMVAVSIVWGAMFAKDGAINYLIVDFLRLGSEKIAWLGTKETALYATMFVTMWKGLGYYMMIYLAGLQSIPTDLVEAAKIDGANRWQVIKNITIPLLNPYIVFCTLMSLMAAIKVFDEIFVLTGGGPGIATYTLSFLIYNSGFKEFALGYAAAVGLIVSIIVVIISSITFIFNKKGGVNQYK